MWEIAEHLARILQQNKYLRGFHQANEKNKKQSYNYNTCSVCLRIFFILALNIYIFVVLGPRGKVIRGIYLSMGILCCCNVLQISLNRNISCGVCKIPQSRKVELEENYLHSCLLSILKWEIRVGVTKFNQIKKTSLEGDYVPLRASYHGVSKLYLSIFRCPYLKVITKKWQMLVNIQVI